MRTPFALDNNFLSFWKLICVSKNTKSKRSVDECKISEDEKDVILKVFDFQDQSQPTRYFNIVLTVSYYHSVPYQISYDLFENGHRVQSGDTKMDNWSEMELINLNDAILLFKKGLKKTEKILANY